MMTAMRKLFCWFGLYVFAWVNAFGAPPVLDSTTKQLSRDIFEQLIDINTTESVGATTPAAQAMKQRLLDAGFADSDLIVDGPNSKKQNLVTRFHGRPGSSLKPILIICHLDVVEAKREDWTSDPFHFEEKDGYFYGRGAQDVKSGDAILVTDLIRFKKEGFVPDRDIIVALTAAEEGGTDNGVKWLLDHHRDWVDAEFVLNPDAGGITLVNGNPTDVQIEATEKLYADYQLTARDPGGHSSLPRPDNAIYELTAALNRLAAYRFPFELNNVTRSFYETESKFNKNLDISGILKNPPDQAAINRLSKDPRDNALMRTTCVATRLNGGHANNALPQSAQAIVNCRILPGHSPEEVRQDLIKVFADPKLSVEYVDSATDQVLPTAPDKKSFAPPPLNKDVMHALTATTNQFWPGIPVIPEMEAGASDSIYTMAAGIPSYGVSGVGIDKDDVRAHGKDERVRVNAYYDGVQFYYSFLKELTSR